MKILITSITILFLALAVNAQSPSLSTICNVTNPISVTIGPNGPACKDLPYMVTAFATGGSEIYQSYQWSNSTTGQTVQVVPTTSPGNIFTVTVTDTEQCRGTGSVTISLKPSLSINIAGPTKICEGVNDNLTAIVTGGSSPYSYSWVPSGNTQTIPINPNVYDYSVTVTDAFDCIGMKTHYVVVKDNPIINSITDPNGDEACLGEQVSLLANVSGGTPPYNYLWTNEANINPNTFIPLSTGDKTQCLTVTDDEGCTDVKCYDFKIHPNPTITSIIASPDTICKGISTDLTVYYTGGEPPYSFLWSNGGNGNPISLIPTSAGTQPYCVTVTDSNACFDTRCYDLIVNSTPEITGFTWDSDNCVGSISPLGVSTSGSTAGYNYEWSNGQITNPIFVVATPGAEYCVTVTNSFGCKYTDCYTLTASVNPIVTIVSESEVCAGESILLEAEGIVGNPTVFCWNTNPPQCGNPITATPTDNNNIFIVTATNSLGCIGTASRQITINPNPLVDIDGPIDTCVGVPITLSADPTGGTSPYTYDWEGTGLTDSSVVVLTAASDTVYIVKVEDELGCVGTATREIEILSNPGVSITPSIDSICLGQTITLEAATGGGSPDYSYEWNTGATTREITDIPSLGTTSYSVTVVDAEQCQGENSTSLVTDTISILINGGTTVCEGTTITAPLVATATGVGNKTITWFHKELTTGNWELLPQCSGNNCNPGIISSSTEYYARVDYDSLGCAPKVSNIERVFTAPSPSPVLVGDQNVCKGQTTVLQVQNITSIGDSELEWNIPDMTGILDTTELDDILIIEWGNIEGTYPITVTEYLGFSGSNCFGQAATFNINISNSSALTSSEIIYTSVNNILFYNDSTLNCYQWGYYDPNSVIEKMVELLDETNQAYIAGESYNPNYKYWVRVSNSEDCNSSSACASTIFERRNLGNDEGLEENLAAQLAVYPNPNKGNFKIVGKNLLENKYTISVVNILGQTVFNKVYQLTDSSLEAEINLEAISAGIYYIKISTTKGSQFIRPLLILNP